MLRSSPYSSPRSIHHLRLSSDEFLVSSLHVFKPPQSCFLAPLCDFIYTSSLSLMSSFLMWYLGVWPHDHLYIFISVSSSFFTWEIVIGSISIPILLVIGVLTEPVLFTADGKCDNNMAHLAKFLSENMSRHEKVMDESIDVVGGVEQNVSNAVLV